MDVELVEKVARAICKSRGIDPDRKMCSGEPERAWGGFFPSETFDAWRLFASDAVAAIEALK